MATAHAGVKSHSKTITVYDFDGLSDQVRKKLIEEVRSDRHWAAYHNLSERLTKDLLPKLLKRHSLSGFCSMHGEGNIVARCYAGAGGVDLEGTVYWWPREGEKGFKLWIVRKIDLEIIGADCSAYKTPSDNMRMRVRGGPEGLDFDGKMEEEFARVYSDICGELSERAREIYRSETSDEALTGLLRGKKRMYLADGSEIGG